MAIPYLWERVACNEQAAEVLARELRISPAVARLLAIRGIDDAGDRAAVSPSVARSSARSVQARRHGGGRGADPGGDRAEGAHRRSWRLRLSTASRRRSSFAVRWSCSAPTSSISSPSSMQGRIRTAAGDVRSAAGRWRAARHLGRLRHSRHRGGAARARAAASISSSPIITSPAPSCRRPLAVINPKRHDCDYPDKNLAGVGVALKLVQALCRKRDRERMLPAFVKVAAIGTLADVVPLVGENRVIAKLGLEMLSQGPHKVGLRALLDVAGLTGKPIDSGHVAFQIAPRMNAAGRMASPDIAARLLLAADEAMAAEAQDLARQLDGENVRRQEEEAAILTQRAQDRGDRPRRRRPQHSGRGGRGLAPRRHRHRRVQAGRRLSSAGHRHLDRRRRRARVVPQHSAASTCSPRSSTCAPHLTRFGGHKQAAGLTMRGRRCRGVPRVDCRVCR